MKRMKGVTVPHLKSTADSIPARITDLDIAVYPMTQHIGAPCEPVCCPGDTVYVGTLLGQTSGGLSSPIYSGVSGTVDKIENILLSSGRYAPAVYILPDGKMTPDPAIVPPVVTDLQSFIKAVERSEIGRAHV